MYAIVITATLARFNNHRMLERQTRLQKKHDRCRINKLPLWQRPCNRVFFLFYASIPAAPPRSDAPLIIVERSPTGIAKGKSTEASMMAKKIHQPAMHVTKEQAPPA